MFIKLFIISLMMVSLVMLTPGIKMLFDRDAEFTIHSCSTGDGDNPEDGGCHSCELKELTQCRKMKK
ncbi:MAG: hypothetical protein J7K46_12090 [Bacteroidales bacterium]|nr:hypothetical protein [Bacteroidales bacterium]